MNWHFTFFLLDIAGWMIIATLLCSRVFIKKSYKINFDISTKFCVITVSLCAGLFSVLINGLPDTGFAINSFMYASFAALTIIFYQIIKTKRNTFPRISKRSRKVAYI